MICQYNNDELTDFLPVGCNFIVINGNFLYTLKKRGETQA